MTFSFDPALSTPKDRVRLLLGDTQPPGWFSDEEINGLLVTVPAPTYAAAFLADSLSARFAMRVDKRIGSTQVSSSQASKAFAALAERLRAQGPDSDGSGVPTAGDMYVGGISHAVVDELRRDSDAVQPSFEVGQDDHYGERSPRSTPTSWDGV